MTIQPLKHKKGRKIFNMYTNRVVNEYELSVEQNVTSGYKAGSGQVAMQKKKKSLEAKKKKE